VRTDHVGPLDRKMFPDSTIATIFDIEAILCMTNPSQNSTFLVTKWALFKLKMHQNVVSRGGGPRTPVWELTMLP